MSTCFSQYVGAQKYRSVLSFQKGFHYLKGSFLRQFFFFLLKRHLLCRGQFKRSCQMLLFQLKSIFSAFACQTYFLLWNNVPSRSHPHTQQRMKYLCDQVTKKCLIGPVVRTRKVCQFSIIDINLCWIIKQNDDAYKRMFTWNW